ncbi:MAG: HAD family hydrolase [Gemmatimonadaceae bacterium]
MTALHEVVFLLDCDNTLFDNDRLETDLGDHLVQTYGTACRARYLEVLEQLRSEVGYADYLGALQRSRQQDVSDARLFMTASYLLDYPFARQVYPGALDVIRQLSTLGPTVILSDGDVVFQPRKVQHSGLWEAVDGRVLIAIHKERTLAAVAARYPARRYVMIDDKLRILAAIKAFWSDRVTTVFPRQGHYALDPHYTTGLPAADLTVERIGDLVNYDWAAQLGRRATVPPEQDGRR